MTTLALHTMLLRRRTVWGGWKAVTLLLEHIANLFALSDFVFELMTVSSMGQCRVQEFVRGGGGGGPAQKISEKIIY